MFKKAELLQFENLFMMAPDVSYDNCEVQKPLENVNRIAKRTFIFYRDTDSGLKKSKFWFTLSERMGNLGPKNKNIHPGVIIPVNATDINDIQLVEPGDDHRYFLKSDIMIKNLLACMQHESLHDIAGLVFDQQEGIRIT